jgi:hypothetical protein
MTKKYFNMRNVVAIAICLAAVLFSGCEKPDKDGKENNNTGTTNSSKRISRIDFYEDGDFYNRQEYHYDAQNRVTEIIWSDGDGHILTTPVAYPDAGTVVMEDFMDYGQITCSLNSEGYIASMSNAKASQWSLNRSYTYANGYLQKIEMPVIYRINDEVFIRTASTACTWENGNLIR